MNRYTLVIPGKDLRISGQFVPPKNRTELSHWVRQVSKSCREVPNVLKRFDWTIKHDLISDSSIILELVHKEGDRIVLIMERQNAMSRR